MYLAGLNEVKIYKWNNENYDHSLWYLIAQGLMGRCQPLWKYTLSLLHENEQKMNQISEMFERKQIISP